MLLQLLTWTATSQVASALAEGQAEGVGVAGAVVVVVLAPTEVVAEAEAGVVAGGTEGVGGADLGLSAKAKAVATGQAKPAEQQLGDNHFGSTKCCPSLGAASWSEVFSSSALAIVMLWKLQQHMLLFPNESRICFQALQSCQFSCLVMQCGLDVVCVFGGTDVGQFQWCPWL